MTILNLTTTHLEALTNLINESIDDYDLRLLKVTPELMNVYFVEEIEGYQKISLAFLSDKTLLGFASGVSDFKRKTNYLTCLFVKKDHQLQGIGKTLLNALEERLINNGFDTIDCVFFNPIQWSFFVNNQSHTHNNMPGVLINSHYESFLKKQGYLPFAYQNLYHMGLINLQTSLLMSDKLEELQAQGIVIEYFNKTTCKNHTNLFKNLNNPGFEQAFNQAILANKPILIARKYGEVIGFTGPLNVINQKGTFSGIGVSSVYGGLGIGKALFYELCHRLKAMGATYMTLFTGTENKARRIYEAQGFEVTQTFTNLRKRLK